MGAVLVDVRRRGCGGGWWSGGREDGRLVWWSVGLTGSRNTGA
jgi:hypothetical protein